MVTSDVSDPDFQRYRGFLRVLARAAIGQRWDRRFDASDLVQETLLDAHRHRGQLRGQSPGEIAAWLRIILERNIAQAMRDHRRERRDLRRELSLDAILDQSSNRLAACLGGGGSTASRKAQRQELAVQVGEALIELPRAQQDAIIGLYIEGLPIDEVARRLERTPTAVTMLVRRGLQKLRAILKER
jgi:RNA polymerase sigma-70 factor (ECF subfamily)